MENSRKREVLTFFTDNYLQGKPEFSLVSASEQSCCWMEPMKSAVLSTSFSALEDGHGICVPAPGMQVGSSPIPISSHGGNC